MNIRSFVELHEALAPFVGLGKRWFFRGHASRRWKLIPKAARVGWRVDDLSALSTWRRRAIQFASALPATDWDWAAVAQHHGLATRLLDWSLNPLAAAFFALEEDRGTAAVVYAFAADHLINPDNMHLAEFSGVGEYRPRGVTQRISQQTAVFTVHSPPSVQITPRGSYGNLHKLILKRGNRGRL